MRNKTRGLNSQWLWLFWSHRETSLRTKRTFASTLPKKLYKWTYVHDFLYIFSEFKVFDSHPETQFKKFYDLAISKISFRFKTYSYYLRIICEIQFFKSNWFIQHKRDNFSQTFPRNTDSETLGMGPNNLEF